MFRAILRSRDRFAAWAIGFVLIAPAGCDESSKPGPCTPEWVYGLRVEVRDAVTGDSVATGALVTARDGVYVDTLEVQPDGLLALGAGERAGIYAVDVSKPGYQPWHTENIQVTRDECHVRPVTVQASLQPQ